MIISCNRALWGAGLVAIAFLTSGSVWAQNFVNFESPHVNPMDISPDGSTLAAVNTADNSVHIYDITQGVPGITAIIDVGLDPVTARFRTDTELWVVNKISDSISVIDVVTCITLARINTEDDPSDVVFAGTIEQAFVSCSLPDVIQVFDTTTHALTATLPVLGESPRGLAVSGDGNTVYAAIFESGNRSTILAGGLDDPPQPELPNVVSDPATPYLGQNPPFNDLAFSTFDPPFNGALPAPPEVGLIVKNNGAGWFDDNGVDWSLYISGAEFWRSNRVAGWDVLDNDIAAIDANAISITGYATGLMNICMTINVHPVTGEISLGGTDATNEVRFEPKLNGTFVRVMGALVDPVTLLPTFLADTNDHLTYASSTIPQGQRDLSTGDPRAHVWASDGLRVFIAGMGSNNVRVTDGVTAFNLAMIEVGEGPTGLALSSDDNLLYVLNRFDGSISVVDANTYSEIMRVPFFDPTPAVIKVGRKHLYDTHKNSGLGQVACASCHIDSKMDRLAWDLGDPSGDLISVADQNLGMSIPGVDVGFEDFHPMKGPMTTQTLQDIIAHEPFHWRGDKDGLEEFNGAFLHLQGDDTNLTAPEMQEFEDYLGTIHFPPNPLREIDNTFPALVSLAGQFASGRFYGSGGLPRGADMPDGDPARGLSIYMGTEGTIGTADGSFNCVTCHTLPLGNGADTFWDGAAYVPFPVGPMGERHSALISMDGSTNRSIKTPHLRNGLEKAGMTLAKPISRAGFGYLHDGSTDSLSSFLASTVFDVNNDQDIADLVALMMCFSGSDFGDPAQAPVFGGEAPPSNQVSLDAHAAVGVQTFIDNAAAVDPLIVTLMDLSLDGAIDLVAHGKVGGALRGWLHLSGNDEFSQWQDDAGNIVTGGDIIGGIAANGPVVGTAVPLGSGMRLALDRDMDGTLNFNEPSTIDITSPSGGESWEQGTTQSITWDSSNVFGLVKIYYSLDGGSTWVGINFSYPNSGTFLWDGDVGLAPGDPAETNVKIRVRSKTNSSASDDSNLLTITAPPAPPTGSSIGVSPTPATEGENATITWPSGEVSHSQVKIYYSLDGGSSWSGINYAAPNTGSYVWPVSVGLNSGDPAETNVKIRVRSKGGHTDFNDESDAFTINAPTPVPPAGSSIGLSPTPPIAIGQNLTITWPSGEVSHPKVKIYYSLNGGSTWVGINYSAPNTGSYVWNVNAGPSANVKIRVRSKGGHTDFNDESDVFEISN